jgi:hypothetical protein
VAGGADVAAQGVPWLTRHAVHAIALADGQGPCTDDAWYSVGEIRR